MKRFDVKTTILLMLPMLVLLFLGLLSNQNLFVTRPALRILKNELSIKDGRRAVHNVEYEVRHGSRLENLFRREAPVDFQNFDFTCIDSKTGKIIPSPSGGMSYAGMVPKIIPSPKRGTLAYAIYYLKDLRKSSGDLKFTMTFTYFEGGTLRKLPVKLTVPHSKLQQ